MTEFLFFKVQKKSKKSAARVGVLKTAYGEIETPSFVPVATQAAIKTLTSEEAAATGSQILICNTYHLHLRPGEKIVKAIGGLHKFMNWPPTLASEALSSTIALRRSRLSPSNHRQRKLIIGKSGGVLMTDSGGFQVFSLGFGRDFGVGKILKTRGRFSFFAAAAGGSPEGSTQTEAQPVNSPPQAAVGRERVEKKEKIPLVVKNGQQPQNIKITDKGVWFKSPLDGQKIFIGPKESMKIQADLGADIIFAFDECTPPLADYEYTKKSLAKTHRWALESLKYRSKKQALFGIVQGGKFRSLREESAKFIGALPFDGFGIGGEFGDNKNDMVKMISWVNKNLPDGKPRHLLGIGHPEDILKIIKAGVDTFDCIAPTHYARRGFAFTSEGKLDLSKINFLKDKKALDKKCDCATCQNYIRSYICYLLRAKEISALRLLTFHNLYFFNKMVARIREDIKKGKV